jgi:hypothetical protein
VYAKNSSNNMNIYNIKFTVKKDAGNVFVISGNDQVQTILEQDIDIGGVSASVLNDGGSYKARIMCTGKANENINWYASVKEFVLNFD